MTKLNWDRVRQEAQVRRYGKEPYAFRAGDEIPNSMGPASSSRSVTKTSKPKSKGRKATPAEREILFLHDVIRCELMGVGPPGLPKAIRKRLEPKVELKGGPLDWAKSHPQYQKIRKGKLKKLKKRNMPIPVASAIGDREMEISKIESEIHLRRQLISEAKIIIANIDNELAQLGEKLKALQRR